jgi:hypothetical protein
LGSDSGNIKQDSRFHNKTHAAGKNQCTVFSNDCDEIFLFKYDFGDALKEKISGKRKENRENTIISQKASTLKIRVTKNWQHV